MTIMIPRTGIGVAQNFFVSLQHGAQTSSRITRYPDLTYTYHVPTRLLSSSHCPGRARKIVVIPSHMISRSICYSPSPSSRNPHIRSAFAASPPSKASRTLTSFSAQDTASPGRYTSSHASITTNRAVRRCFHQQHSVQRSPASKEEDNKVSKESKSTTTDQSTSSGGEHFYDRLHMPNFHRPTKEELLAAATGFWSRMKVRFKWATIKSMRPFNADEIFGFFSWIALGHVLWLIIGTTTFVSLAILAINTVLAQETLARWVGNYLTQSSGLQVVFESAIVPRWGDGVITFKNVFVSRRPGQSARSSVTKGSPEEAAAAAARLEIPAEEQNYTQFDITLGEVNVTLSFSKWWNSKGLLQNVEIKHVRGVVDRTHVFWTGEELDPKSYRHEHAPGDFEIESFKIEDLLVTLHQPKEFRPFTISIFNADLPRLRKQWMMYDFLCATNVTGEFDHSLFTIHPRQTHNYTGALLNDVDENEPWKKQNRIRIDGLNIDHLNRGVEGPFGWIHEGNVDIVADLMIPSDSDASVMKVMTDFYDQIEAQLFIKKRRLHEMLDTNSNFGSGMAHDVGNGLPTRIHSTSSNDDRRYLIMDLRIHLNDVRAVVPLFTKDLSYVNNALIRPIVAYINSRRTFIPINCRVVKKVNDFDGSWTIFDSGLMDELSAETYEAFSRDVQDEQARLRRFKKVGLWSLQLAVQAIFLGLSGTIA